MKKNLLLFGLLTLATQTFAQISTCLPAWQYRMPLTVSNANATALADHQVNVVVNTQALINAGKMNVDGSDMRFAIDCCTPACYWIESGINTTTTSVWVNVSAVPASGSSTLFMYYGNAGASDESNAVCVFDVYDGFDNDTTTQFTESCGAGTTTYSGGLMNISWSSNVMFLSNNTLPAGNVYTIESNITAASGSWPGIYSMRATDTRSYGLLKGSSDVRISLSSTSVATACDGHNWASPVVSMANPVGLWSLTWRATGDIIANFPSVGPMTSTDATFALNDDLVVGLGGISGGTGSMSVDWIRARKYAAITPTYVFGAEEVPAGAQAVSITAPSTSFCAGDSLMLDAGTGFTAYDWSTGATTQGIYVSTPATYIITATDAAGCMSQDSVEIIQYVSPVSSFTDVVAVGNVTFTNTSTGGTTYAWDFGDGNTSTQQNPTHVYTANGTYTVCLTTTSANGCTDEVCNDVIVSSIGLNTLDLLSFEIYPNPTSTELNVVSPMEDVVTYELTSIDGKIVQTGKLKTGANVLNVTSVESGTYILRVSNLPGYGSRIVVQ